MRKVFCAALLLCAPGCSPPSGPDIAGRVIAVHGVGRDREMLIAVLRKPDGGRAKAACFLTRGDPVPVVGDTVQAERTNRWYEYRVVAIAGVGR